MGFETYKQRALFEKLLSVQGMPNIKDAYPKMLVARTRHGEYQYEGVKIIDVADWLTEARV